MNYVDTFGNMVAINEAEKYIKALRIKYMGSLEGAILGCILKNWGNIAEKLDEALTRHYWNKATIVIKCLDASRNSLFLAFTRRDKESEWHLDPDRTRVSERGGFLYKWEIEVYEGMKKAVLVENKRLVKTVAKP
jgi:hypothetical protein